MLFFLNFDGKVKVFPINVSLTDPTVLSEASNIPNFFLNSCGHGSDIAALPFKNVCINRHDCW